MDGGNRESDDCSADQSTIQLRRAYDWSATAPSNAAIDALARIENVEPTELGTVFDTTLYDHVDPEALDTLVRDGKSEAATITISIDRYRCRFEDGELVITETDSSSSQ